jgi:hypothetical protein
VLPYFTPLRLEQSASNALARLAGLLYNADRRVDPIISGLAMVSVAVGPFTRDDSCEESGLFGFGSTRLFILLSRPSAFTFRH